MSDSIELFCLVLGKSAEHTFPVRISKDFPIAALKKAILRECTFPDIKAYQLTLWKVSIPLDDHTDGALKDFVPESDGKRTAQWLRNPSDKLRQVFGDESPDGHIQVIVQRPPSLNTGQQNKSEDGDITVYLQKKFEKTLRMFRSRTPSNCAKSHNYKAYQRSGCPIFDGRYDVDHYVETKAPPIQLYHPVFGHFLDDIANPSLPVPPAQVRATSRLMHKTSGIYNHDNERSNAIEPDLAEAVAVSSDGPKIGAMATAISTGLIHAEVSFCTGEDSNELGERNYDPSVQAGLSYGRFWAKDENAIIRDSTCCPSFLLATSGPWLVILGAIFTDKVIVQRLTDFIWIGNDAVLNNQRVFYVARILYSLGRSVETLSRYYISVKPMQPLPGHVHPRYLPSIRDYRDHTGTIVPFTLITFLKRDPTCVTFLAMKREAPIPNLLVVKFVQRYGEDAHRLLAEENMAPQLLYCGRVGVHEGDPIHGHLCMVVMECLDGARLDELEAKHRPQELRLRLQAILDRLHDHGYVFGKLCAPNIMVTKSNDVKLISFDWAGREGEARYPVMVSAEVKPEGVEGLDCINKSHDDHMLKQLMEG